MKPTVGLRIYWELVSRRRAVHSPSTRGKCDEKRALSSHIRSMPTSPPSTDQTLHSSVSAALPSLTYHIHWPLLHGGAIGEVQLSAEEIKVQSEDHTKQKKPDQLTSLVRSVLLHFHPSPATRDREGGIERRE